MMAVALKKSQEQSSGSCLHVVPCNKRSNYLYPISLWLLTLAAMVWFLREPNYVDDASYFQYAKTFLADPGEPGTANKYRLGLIVPTAIAQLFFGYTPTAYYFVPFLFCGLFPVALYVFMRVLGFPPFVGFVCGLLGLGSPTFLSYATILRVDFPSLTCFLLGFAAAIKALNGGETLDRRRGYAVVAALLIYLSTTFKETILPGILSVPFILLFASQRDRHSFRIFFFLVGCCLLGALTELLTHSLLYGDPFARIKSILSLHVAGSRDQWISMKLVKENTSWLDLLARYPIHYWSAPVHILFSCSVIGGTIWAVMTRSKRLLLLIALGLTSFLFLSFAVSSVDPLVPLLRMKERYFSVAYYPLLLLAVGALYEGSLLLSARKQPSLLSISAITLFASVYLWLSLSQEVSKPYYVHNGGRAMQLSREVAEELDKDPATPVNGVLSGVRTTRVLRMYLPEEYHDKILPIDYQTGRPYFDYVSERDYFPGDLVVLNMSRLNSNQRYLYRNRLPHFIHVPPTNWQHLGSTAWRGFQIYYVHSPEMTNAIQRKDPESLEDIIAYQYKKTDGEITREEGADTTTFRFNRSNDLRIVTGAGLYQKRPSKGPSYLHIDKPMELYTKLTLSHSESIQYVKGFLVLFSKGESKPELIKLKFGRDEGKILLGRRLLVDPKKGHQYFRLMLSFRGSGSIRAHSFEVNEVAFHTGNIGMNAAPLTEEVADHHNAGASKTGV